MQPPVLAAAPHWRRIDFISDLHLQPACAATAQGWRGYLATTPADALFILGDLFEVWVGDDLMQHDSPEGHFAADCAAALRDAGRRLDLHLMRGNRDFLLGEGFAQASGTRLLPDPLRLDLGPQRWLLTHGDALCLDDV
ncbi:MAG: UDP-2,3-diacylglucosamine diphosphatase, partial [Rhodoferax sp.]|nr:UDP-2,3-diacylglucosamine diphosphatase [Rhodoferax sp.]